MTKLARLLDDNNLLPYKRHCGRIFMVKIGKEKENKKKNETKQKQTNKHKRQGRKGYTNNPGGRALNIVRDALV